MLFDACLCSFLNKTTPRFCIDTSKSSRLFLLDQNFLRRPASLSPIEMATIESFPPAPGSLATSAPSFFALFNQPGGIRRFYVRSAQFPKFSSSEPAYFKVIFKFFYIDGKFRKRGSNNYFTGGCGQ